LPARLQKVVVAGRPLAVLAVLSCLVAGLRVGGQAQVDVIDSDLAAISTRTVALGAAGGGKIGDVPLEVYVARVLAGEGEPNAPEATQQALAIAIRTYAVFNTGKHKREGFDLCDSVHCQVPRSANANSRRAALATAGRILTYKGAPAEIFYSASCGGRSETASAAWPNTGVTRPYLRSVKDDVHDDDVPWTLEKSLWELQTDLERNGFRGTLKNVEIKSRTKSDRAAILKLSGMRPDRIAGDQFRAAIGTTVLRSTAFSLKKDHDTVRFTGRGYGHGVGMCVIGAGRRARRGESTADILKAYYPGLKIELLSS
jgi:stage II sporulation protein D